MKSKQTIYGQLDEFSCIIYTWVSNIHPNQQTISHTHYPHYLDFHVACTLYVWLLSFNFIMFVKFIHTVACCCSIYSTVCFYTICLFILMMIGIWVLSSLELLWIELLWMSVSYEIGIFHVMVTLLKFSLLISFKCLSS